MKRVIAAALLAVSLTGCNQSIPSTWVSAERARLDSVGAEYRAYYSADPTLDAGDKARRDRTMELWTKDVEAHEAAIKAGGGN